MATGSQPLLRTRHGSRLLAVLCAVAFLDFVDATITNVALPHIRTALGFSVQTLQWVPSAYLLTYGGLMLLGGRLADLLGRRRILLIGTVLVAGGSLTGGLAGSGGVFVAARLVQGAGAALMLPAALSILTTTFSGSDRARALGVWGGVAGLSSAVGILLGGALVQGPGWRWVMFVNPIACALIVPAAIAVLAADRRTATSTRFDLAGSTLVTGAMLLLVFALVEAPIQGWGAAATWLEFAGAAFLLAAFVAAERLVRDPIVPLGTFAIRGLAAANVTGLVGFAGMLAMFFFLTLYMQTVLGYSPFVAGAAYLPLTLAVGVSSGVGAKLLTKAGSRTVISAGALIAAGAALPDPGTRQLPAQHPPRADAVRTRDRAGVRRRHLRRERRGHQPAGRAHRRHPQLRPADRRRAGSGDPLRPGHQPDQPPAGRRPHRSRGRDRGLPPRPARRRRVRPGGRGDRVADRQHPPRPGRGPAPDRGAHPETDEQAAPAPTAEPR
jgi:MFS family permease